MHSKRRTLGGVVVASFVIVGACVGDDPQGGGTPVAARDAGGGEGSSSGSSSGASGGSSSGETLPDAATVCPANVADCDGDGACEAALATDPTACGACGHDCQGGLCSEGKCLPHELASDLLAPISVAVNSTGVFWIDASQALKCPKSGCTGSRTVLSRGTTQTEYLGRRQLFVNETAAYWLGASIGQATRVYVQSCEVAGCQNTPTVLGEEQAKGQLVGNADSLFAYDPTGSLRRIPLAGGAAVLMTKTYRESSFAFAVLGEKLAFSNLDDTATGANGIWLGTTADEPAPRRMMDRGLHLALNSTTIFASVGLAAEQYVVRCAATGCGGTGTPLFQDPEGPIEDLIADDAAVYWSVAPLAGGNGSIRMCPLPDCAGGPRTIAANQAAPAALALDSEFVYWGNRGRGGLSGSIQRVRR